MTGYVLLPKQNLPTDDTWALSVRCQEVDGRWYVWSEGRQRWEECLQLVKDIAENPES